METNLKTGEHKLFWNLLLGAGIFMVGYGSYNFYNNRKSDDSLNNTTPPNNPSNGNNPPTKHNPILPSLDVLNPDDLPTRHNPILPDIQPDVLLMRRGATGNDFWNN